jgi:hypothetical protein
MCSLCYSELLELIDDSDLSHEERLAKLTFYHKVSLLHGSSLASHI